MTCQEMTYWRGYKMENMVLKYIPMTETACYILLSLLKKRHGYNIVKHVEKITDNKVTLGNGTLYGTLSRMEKDGLILCGLDEKERKVYQITTLGREILENEKIRLTLLVKNLERSEMK